MNEVESNEKQIILPVIPGKRKVKERKNAVIDSIIKAVDGSEEKWVQIPTASLKEAIGSEGSGNSILTAFRNLLDQYLLNEDKVGAYTAGWVEDSHKEFVYVEQRRLFSGVKVVVGSEEGNLKDYKNIQDKIE